MDSIVGWDITVYSGGVLIRSGLACDLRKQYPSLTPAKMKEVLANAPGTT
jgi:hypothetical protein